MKRAILLFFLVVAAIRLDAQNPFVTPGQPERAPAYVLQAPQLVRDWSRTLQREIGTLSRSVRAGAWNAVLPAVLLSILFGVVHIAGPGHGKVFAVSYFSGRKAKIRDGILYSAIVNIVDSVSAFVMVMLGYVVLTAVSPNLKSEAPRILQLVSYGAIIAFGSVHLISHLFSHRHGKACSRNPEVETSEKADRPSVPLNKRRTRMPPWLLAATVGLVPCPVDTVLLVYGIANDVLPFMIIMVVGVSFGGFLMMSLISVSVILGRTKVLSVLRAPAANRVTSVLEHLMSATIIVFGLVFFLAVL